MNKIIPYGLAKELSIGADLNEGWVKCDLQNFLEWQPKNNKIGMSLKTKDQALPLEEF
ncbi:MAG: hypothetical protein ACTSWY_06935 [Promethearchaeota archaeon]